MKRIFYLAWLALLAAGCEHHACAQSIFGAPTLDPSFCQLPNFRRTVVYIDDMMMIDGKTDWAVRLADKLHSSLSPGEQVTVVRLSPAEGQSKEVWSGCWPAYTDDQIAKLRAQTYFFQKNPADQVKDQQKLFFQGLNGAFANIYTAAKRPVSAVVFDTSSAPTKQIIRSLANDEGRFSSAKLTVRAIVYSDMAENSDLGSVFKPVSAEIDYGAKLGSYLRRSVFYAFGAGGDVRGDESFLDSARQFWLTAFRSMGSTVGGIATDLNVPNSLPVVAAEYNVQLSFQGQMLDGKMSLLSDADGNLVDSWLGFPQLTSSVLTGTYNCSGGDRPLCKLDAHTNGGLATKTASEEVILTGPQATGLRGHLGIRGSNAMFDLVTVSKD